MSRRPPKNRGEEEFCRLMSEAQHRHIEYPNGNKARIKFAREPFKKFAEIFNTSYNCKGASINKEKLEYAINQDKAKMIVVGYKDGSMYQYPAQAWKKWAETHGTIRDTDYQDKKETTYSIPLKKMEKIQ